MAEAKRPGGLYFVGDTAVDANGVAVENPPKKQKDTPPSEQPGAIGNPSSDPIQRLADILAPAVGAKSARHVGVAIDDSKEEVEPPTLAELPDHLAGLKTVAEVKALQKGDARVGAKPMYAARLAELSGDGEE